MAHVNYCSNVKYFPNIKKTYHFKIKMRNEKYILCVNIIIIIDYGN